MLEIIEKIDEAVKLIKSKTSVKPRVGITLGSGLNSVANSITVDTAIPFSDIPNFPKTTVEGHKGQLIIGHIGDVPVIAMQGRIHYYEGYSMQDVVFPTRVMALLGIHSLILTNSAGGMDEKMQAGDFMIITDHINLFGDHPLKGPNIEKYGPRFPDMTYAYNPELIATMEELFGELDIRYHKGVYCGVTGPTYETPAEIKFLKMVGGSAVGMSTVPEVIAANHLGLRVAGLSCITNMAAGITGLKLSHHEVQEVAGRVEKQFSKFLLEFVKSID
ncbi:MAG: purine-nucleoside phosphorylase [Bdellovibrionaceae bacterium]|nr:purine-nucleoside phosphorylase [Pseudobdellovibrionaceae bacterium]